MLKKFLASLAAATAAAAGMLAFSISAYATTVDDVAEVARSYGYSEEDIQAGYNEYYAHPEDYPEEKLDKAIKKLHEAGGQMVTTGPQVVDNTTTTVDASTQEPDNIPEGAIMLTASDGTTFYRISREEFIAMSYDEKMAYISGFTPAQQQAIIDDLSPEEYRSIMKQMPADQKVQVVGTLSEAVEEMGLNITVSEITDDSLTVAMKNSKGELLNVSTAGARVEDTGYDRRGLIAAAGAFIAAGAAALFVLIRRLKFHGAEN